MQWDVLCMADLWFFSDFNVIEKNKIRSLAAHRNYAKGEIVMRESDPAERVYLVTSGKVKLFKLSEEGKEIILDYIQSGTLFGEEGLFGDHIYSVSAASVDTSHICSCTKKDFASLIVENPSLALKVIGSLGEKVQALTDSVENLALHDVESRITRALARLAKTYGREEARGVLLDFKLTHEDLGSLTGASRVMVTRCLNKLKGEGIIAQNGKRQYVLTSAFFNNHGLISQ